MVLLLYQRNLYIFRNILAMMISKFGFLLDSFVVLLCCQRRSTAASNFRERKEVAVASSSNLKVTAIVNSCPTVKSTQIPSISPTSIPTSYKHITKILPKFTPSCAPSQPPSITTFQNPQIRFNTPINYFLSNPTANLAQLEPQQEVSIRKHVI